jgi:uncharacterized membrane protein YfcA
MRALLVSPLGFLIGVSLGALGGGGSILAVPVLVYAAGQTPKQATASSLILVSMTALVGIVPHWRAGRVRVVAGLLFSLAGVGASLLASHWNALVDDDVLLLAFAGLMLVVAALMVRSLRRPRLVASASSNEPVRIDVATVAKVIGAGSVVGFLTGFFGVGGGFVIVPALVLALGFSMPEAVGTSLLVIVVNSMVALSTRLDSGNVDWSVIVPFAVSSLAGVLVGGRLAGRHDPSVLQRWFVGLLVAVAVYTAVRSGLALADG